MTVFDSICHAMTGNNANCFVRDEVGAVSGFKDGLLVAVPIVNSEAGGGVVRDGLIVVVDAPAIVTVLVMESLAHRELAGKPFSAVPFPADRGKVTRLGENLGNRSFLGGEAVNPPRFITGFIFSQLHAEFGEVAGFSKVFGTPVTPCAEGVAPGEESRPGGSTNGMNVKLGKACSLLAQLGKMRGVFGGTSVEGWLVPADIIREDEDNVGFGAIDRRGQAGK